MLKRRRKSKINLIFYYFFFVVIIVIIIVIVIIVIVNGIVWKGMDVDIQVGESKNGGLGIKRDGK